MTFRQYDLLRPEAISLAVNGSLCFSYTSKHTLSAGTNLRVLLKNTSTTKKVIVTHSVFFGDAFSFISFYYNPTTDLPSTVHPIFYTDLSKTYSGETQMLADTNATPMSGGTDLYMSVGVGLGGEITRAIPFIIPPSTAMGFDLGAANNTDCYIGFFWLEKTV